MPALALALSASWGCKPKRTTVPPLCAFETVSAQESAAKSLPALVWLTLVSPTVNTSSMTRSGPLTSACGQSHPGLPEDFECPGVPLEVERRAGDTVEATDVVINQLGENRVLLWAATDELVDGQAEGTAAMAVWTETGLEIHAVGTLRGYREGARIKLHSVADAPVLVIEGDRCDPEGNCVRVAQVVPLINRQLRELPLIERQRGCIGRAQFVLTKKTERPLPGGWVRHFELQRSIDLVEGGGLVLHDRVTANDLDTRNPNAPPRPVRKISAERPLTLIDGHWELVEEDLWERVLRDDGGVREGTPAPAEDVADAT